MQYSFLGSQTKFKKLPTDWKEDKIIIKRQNLAFSNVKLGDAAVTSDRVSMKIAGDIQYNAKVFKVAQIYCVEKLLSRIPKIEMDKDGDSTTKGKKVKDDG
ncbi:MAG: hypothetical protein ACI9DK_001554 [Vicingaceae bacterium]